MSNLPKKIPLTDSFEFVLIGFRVVFLACPILHVKFTAAGWSQSVDAQRFNVTSSTLHTFLDDVYLRIKFSICHQPESRDLFVRLDRKIPKILIFNPKHLGNAIRVLESSEE